MKITDEMVAAAAKDVLLARLERFTRKILPRNWKAGLKCPECGADANRQKCMWDMGGACPRHDPNEYEPTPYIEIPDEDVHEAIARILQLEHQNDEHREVISILEEENARLDAENAELLEGLKKLGGMEAFTVPFALKKNNEGDELRARVDFARALIAKHGERNHD